MIDSLDVVVCLIDITILIRDLTLAVITPGGVGAGHAESETITLRKLTKVRPS